jgi:hypothetical protein
MSVWFAAHKKDKKERKDKKDKKERKKCRQDERGKVQRKEDERGKAHRLTFSRTYSCVRRSNVVGGRCVRRSNVVGGRWVTIARASTQTITSSLSRRYTASARLTLPPPASLSMSLLIHK